MCIKVVGPKHNKLKYALIGAIPEKENPPLLYGFIKPKIKELSFLNHRNEGVIHLQ